MSILPAELESAIVERARIEVERGVRYDSAYRRLASGSDADVPADVGACSDLVIRALRAVDVDLQLLVHEDVLAFPFDYPFGNIGDSNIDHRRVPTLFVYFQHNALSLDTDVRQSAATFRPGDIVFYGSKRCTPKWPCIPKHVAIVSDRMGRRGLPLILQNGGPQAAESDSLEPSTMFLVGHFRLTRAQLTR